MNEFKSFDIGPNCTPQPPPTDDEPSSASRYAPELHQSDAIPADISWFADRFLVQIARLNHRQPTTSPQPPVGMLPTRTSRNCLPPTCLGSPQVFCRRQSAGGVGPPPRLLDGIATPTKRRATQAA